MDPIKRAALYWYNAECTADSSLPWNLTCGDIYALAIPRVRAVFAGEVRWSETGPGDKAIWRGRPRDIEAATTAEEWFNVYDTISFDERTPVGTHKLFGVENIGNVWRSNLQVPGQILCEHAALVHHMYAEVSRDLVATDQSLVTLHVGRKVISTRPLRDLVCQVVRLGTTIPRHHDVGVFIDYPRRLAPIDIVIHLEGSLLSETWAEGLPSMLGGPAFQYHLRGPVTMDGRFIDGFDLHDHRYVARGSVSISGDLNTHGAYHIHSTWPLLVSGIRAHFAIRHGELEITVASP